MRTLNVQRVQLPDGTCVMIEGGNAEDTARFLQANYLGQQPLTNPSGNEGDDDEDLLPLPSMFSPVEGKQAPAALIENDADDEPLPLPSMFPPTPEKKTASARIETDDDDEPLPVPGMIL